jgi:hypothetical protein
MHGFTSVFATAAPTQGRNRHARKKARVINALNPNGDAKPS